MDQNNKNDAFKYQMGSNNLQDALEEAMMVNEYGDELMLDDAGRVKVVSGSKASLSINGQKLSVQGHVHVQVPKAPNFLLQMLGQFQVPQMGIDFENFMDMQRRPPPPEEKQSEEKLFRDVKRFRKNLGKRKFGCERALEKWQELRHNVDVLRDVYADQPEKWAERSADLEKQVALIKKKLGFMANSPKRGK